MAVGVVFAIVESMVLPAAFGVAVVLNSCGRGREGKCKGVTS